MILSRLGLLRTGVRMLNLAPEAFMICLGRVKIGDGYQGADYDPSLFAKWGQPILQIDLCGDLGKLPAEHYDVIMHNHVLEHVPCDVSKVLAGLNRAIKPGGYHLFSAPIRVDAETIEDFNPALTPQDRRRLFGQEDHMRYFGDSDFENFARAAGMTAGMLDLRKLFSDGDIAAAGLPAGVLDTVNSHRVFVWRKQ